MTNVIYIPEGCKLPFCMNNGSEQVNELKYCSKFIFKGALKILTNMAASGGKFFCPLGSVFCSHLFLSLYFSLPLF
jgi:hypothetical protein